MLKENNQGEHLPHWKSMISKSIFTVRTLSKFGIHYRRGAALHCIFFFSFLFFTVQSTSVTAPVQGGYATPMIPGLGFLHPYTFDRCTQMQCNRRSPTCVNYTQIFWQYSCFDNCHYLLMFKCWKLAPLIF